MIEYLNVVAIIVAGSELAIRRVCSPQLSSASG